MPALPHFLVLNLPPPSLEPLGYKTLVFGGWRTGNAVAIRGSRFEGDEPYVVAADVYSEPPHVGRGGWTWYTGSAGWMYRAGIESILGLRRQGAFLLLDPCIPKHWPGFEITHRYDTTRYDIVVENPHGVCRGIASLELDGQSSSGAPIRLPLVNDGKTHRVRVVLG